LTDDDNTTFLISRRLLQDVWQMPAAGAPPRRLTADGNNDAVALSRTGRLLIQKRRRQGGYAVLLYEPNQQTPSVATSGPSDMMPSFDDHGRAWYFIRTEQEAIVRCDETNACRPIHVDPQGPAWPVPSPSGQELAYLTWLGTPRLKVLSMQTGASRTLGAALADCPPIWSDNDHLWVVHSNEKLLEWTEIEVASGRPTGRQKSLGDGPDRAEDCVLGGGPLAPLYPQARVIGRETSEIRAISTLASERRWP